MTLDLNSKVTVFASTLFAAGANDSDPIDMTGHKGILLVLDHTAEAGTDPTLDVKLQGRASESSDWVDIPGAAFAQSGTPAVQTLTVYPGIAETANVSVSDNIGFEQIRTVSTVGGTATPTATAQLSGMRLG